MILPPDEDEEDGPLVPLPRVLRNASVRSEVNWVSRKSSRYFILLRISVAVLLAALVVL